MEQQSPTPPPSPLPPPPLPLSSSGSSDEGCCDETASLGSFGSISHFDDLETSTDWPFAIDDNDSDSGDRSEPAPVMNEPGSEPASLLIRAEVEQPNSVNAGYKIVFDNIDKNVKPRYS